MASSFYSNSQHIDFDSVLAMDDQCMLSMFQALMASGLPGFLECPAVIYEAALVDFFENSSVREGVIISTVAGQLVEISEEWFAESFDLPVDGLGDLSEIPKDVIFDARSIVSLSGEIISLSGKKNQMKIEFRLLCDIMVKSISVKAGSFNAITVEKFSMVSAVVCGVRMNWASILFSILKKMVTPGSKQANGFAVQISLLLENIPNLELGESSEFSASKILSEKTVHRFVSLNDKVGAEEAAGAPKPKAASKKRQAVAAVGAPVIKKKRTMRKKSSSSKDNLEIVAVAQEAVPIQMVEPITVAPAVEDLSDQPAGKTDGEEAVAAEVDASADRDQTAVEVGEASADKYFSLVDDPDTVINQVLHQLDSISDDKDDKQSDRVETWFDRAFDEMLRNDSPVVTPSDTDEEEETVDVGPAGRDQQVQFSEEEPVVMEMNDELLDTDEKMSLEDILLTIPADVSLPSAVMEITKINMGKEIKIPEVNERTWFLNSLPKIPADNKGKAILVEKDPVKGNPAKEHYFLICADIDLLVNLRAQTLTTRTELESQEKLTQGLTLAGEIHGTGFTRKLRTNSFSHFHSCSNAAPQRKQMKELSKGNPAPPRSSKTKAGCDGNRRSKVTVNSR
ncbi:dystroglycan-like [Dorcoceras hygrometricum]|uniref:Dystroglycan-like n=1 Tax=Dorcoceras hygrometricum TaxID=472368 RepID=A0A2Z7B8G4_9LAMI|nr:dystroglycan-like [Dorcoceras hygrometricum]